MSTYAHILAPSLALFLREHPAAQVWLSQLSAADEGADDGYDIVLMLDSASSKYRESTGLIPYPIELDAIADQGLAVFVVPGMEMSEPVRLYLDWLNEHVA